MLTGLDWHRVKCLDRILYLQRLLMTVSSAC